MQNADAASFGERAPRRFSTRVQQGRGAYGKRHHQPKKRRESLLRKRVVFISFSRVSRKRGGILAVSINRVKRFFESSRMVEGKGAPVAGLTSVLPLSDLAIPSLRGQGRGSILHR